MKKMLVLLAVLCCILSACGTQDTPEPTEAATLTQTETPTDAPTEAPGANIPMTLPLFTAAPLPTTVDVNNLDNCTVSVSLEKGGIYKDDSGEAQMKVTVYTYDLYDMVDISKLRGGDTIVIRGEDVVIEALERTESGAVLINGGLDLGGYELRTHDNTVYYEIGYSDAKSWYSVGEAGLEVSDDFVFTDASDPDKEPVTYTFEDLAAEDSSVAYYFFPDNTTITIENGVIISMERIYTP